jgi:HPt (histidine-containing phosphotransfer) domain-containing protein
MATLNNVTENTSETCTLDPTALAKIREDDGGHPSQIVSELLKIFYNTTPQRIELLENATRAGDVKSLHQVAHSLKSSCAYVGALHMRALCLQLEDMCKRQRTSDADVVVHKIKSEYQEVKRALEEAFPVYHNYM